MNPMRTVVFLAFGILLAAVFFWATRDCVAAPIRDSTLTSAELASINSVQVIGNHTVGNVIVWSQATDPLDMMDRRGLPVWLECDGSPIPAAYTELHAVIPSGMLPDYRNQFLRGAGSLAVGTASNDTTREHYHGQPSHTHTFNGRLVSGKVSGTASSQTYTDMWTDIGHGGYSLKEGDLSELGHQVRDSSPRQTSGGTISGNIINTTVTGTLSASGGDNTYKNSNSDGTTGGIETAPKHIRVRYLIRALP